MVPGAVSHTILCCQGWGLASWRVPASLGRNLEQSLGELKLGRMRDGCSLKPFLIVLPLPNFSPGFTSAWVPFNPCQVECGSWEETQAGEAELIQTQICCAVRMCCCGEKSLLPVASCSLSQRPGLCPRPLPLPLAGIGRGSCCSPCPATSPELLPGQARSTLSPGLQCPRATLRHQSVQVSLSLVGTQAQQTQGLFLRGNFLTCF